MVGLSLVDEFRDWALREHFFSLEEVEDILNGRWYDLLASRFDTLTDAMIVVLVAIGEFARAKLRGSFGGIAYEISVHAEVGVDMRVLRVIVLHKKTRSGAIILETRRSILEKPENWEGILKTAVDNLSELLATIVQRSWAR